MGFGSPSLTTVARAEGEAVTLGNNGTLTTSAKSTTPAKGIPTEAVIKKLLSAEKFVEAEEAYMRMVAGWHEEKPALAVQVEAGLLAKQSQDGDAEALVALVRAGELNGMNTIRDMLRTGKMNLSPAQQATVTRFLGVNGSFADMNLLKGQLSSTTPAIVNAAIDGLGSLGDTNILPDLYLLAAKSDINRSLLIARAVYQMGAKDDLIARYQVQLDTPFEYPKVRAAMMLASNGDKSGWALLQKALTEKTPQVYPAVLSVLGEIDVPEAQQYVLAGLAGNEAEKLAALQSIRALSITKIDDTLSAMLADPKNSMTVKLAVIDQLMLRNTGAARKTLQKTATISGDNTQLAVAAINALSQCGAIADDGVRGTIRVLALSDNRQIATAARAALLKNALRTQVHL
jgi:HEAT repeat protein